MDRLKKSELLGKILDRTIIICILGIVTTVLWGLYSLSTLLGIGASFLVIGLLALLIAMNA